MADLGIIDLQGGVAEHIEHFEHLGLNVVRIKKPSDVPDKLAGLVIPGGESTCLTRLISNAGLEEVIRSIARQGGKLWGTCAGAIMLAERLVKEEPKIPLVDIEIERNAFGSQLQSFSTTARIPEVSELELPLTFIRAPKILNAGEGVRVLLRQKGYIAMAESDDVLVTVFHPELTPSLAVHRYFAEKCGLTTKDVPDIINDAAIWNITSWTKHQSS